MSQSYSNKEEQSVDSERTDVEERRFQSLVLKDGSLYLLNSDNDLPESLIKANKAVATGQIEEAIHLLNDQAVKAVLEILEKDRSRTDVIFVLAKIFSQVKQMNKAKQWYEKILNQEPHALVYNELGYVCLCTGRMSEAIQYQRKAVEADPNETELHANLAKILIEAGKTQEGINLLRKTVEKEPRNAVLHSNLLFYLHYLPDLDQQMLFDEHKRWGLIHAPASLAKVSHNNAPNPDRRLRVGYISPDFCTHSVAYFFEPLLDGHNHEAVEVYGYGNVKWPDKTTERLKQKFDHYRNIRGVSNEDVVRSIEQDKIDILVELAGHTTDNSLLVLVHKPAPIQVTYLGSPDTTGIQAIDYRFTDSLADLPESQKFYTEELAFLPDGFLCYRPSDSAPPVTSLTALRKGYVTFGSFNNNSKIHPPIMALWAQILEANSDSRLVLKFGTGADQEMANYYFRHFEQLGIARERIAICGYKPAAEHLQLYGEVDIALDTYPFNGYTTACETLWMGVPIISLVGKCHASRVGLSILSSIGLEFFAASTPREYVDKATALAQNLQGLSKIRASMRERMTNSTLCDIQAFAQRVEEAYRKMWYRWIESNR